MKTQWTTRVSMPRGPGEAVASWTPAERQNGLFSCFFPNIFFSVQIPPSTTYAITPMKRPMEEDGEEKSPSKKKKKIQKKGIGIDS